MQQRVAQEAATLDQVHATALKENEAAEAVRHSAKVAEAACLIALTVIETETNAAMLAHAKIQEA